MLGRSWIIPTVASLLTLIALSGPTFFVGPSSSPAVVVPGAALPGPRLVDPGAIDEHALADRAREEAERLAAEEAARTAREAAEAARAERERQAAAARQQPVEPEKRAVSSDVAATVALGEQMAAERGWTGAQWGCLYQLWARESGWRVEAHNNSSGAHGVPQALPGSKMGPGWENDPVVQLTWGLSYLSARYGTPCAADDFQRRNGWY